MQFGYKKNTEFEADFESIEKAAKNSCQKLSTKKKQKNCYVRQF
jgi:hypothetical protein